MNVVVKKQNKLRFADRCLCGCDVRVSAGVRRGRRGVGTARQVRARRPLILNTHTGAHLHMFHYKYLLKMHTSTLLSVESVIEKVPLFHKKALGFVTLRGAN